LFFDAVFRFTKPKEFATPEVSVALSDAVIFPEQDNKIIIVPRAFSNLWIDRWNVYIKGKSGNVVKTYSRISEPTKNLEWDGKDENNGAVLSEGLYSVTIEAWDKSEGYAVSEPAKVRVMMNIADDWNSNRYGCRRLV